MKIHVGSGCVYLEGYVNVDLPQVAGLAAQNEPGVRKWRTTVENYYGRVKVSEASLKANEPQDHADLVCDAHGSWMDLPFENSTADEILSVQCFEHLSKTEAHRALGESRRVLKIGGLLRLDVPDHEETLRQYCETRDEFLLRHLLGSRKNDFAYHMGSWTREHLIAFCAKRGFEFVQEYPNIHCYPAFCLEFRKAPMSSDQECRLWKAAWEYCGDPLGTPLTIPADWKVLEIGPGANPWQRANVYVDRNPETVGVLKSQEKMALNFDVCDLPPVWDKEFDFVFAAHILEHTEDPVKAAAAISRVGKSGIVVCPGISKDSLFCFHEADHKWFVHAGKDRLYFLPQRSEWREAVYDYGVSNELHRIWRYGETRLQDDSDLMRRWFQRSEPHLDTIFRWEGELKVEVCE